MMGARGFPGVQRGNVNLVIGSFGHPGFGHLGYGYPHGRYYRGWPYGGYYGYPYYGWGYGDDSYSSDSYQNYPAYDYSNAYAEDDRQQAAIDRLEGEVDRLREEREARQAQSSNASREDSSTCDGVGFPRQAYRGSPELRYRGPDILDIECREGEKDSDRPA